MRVNAAAPPGPGRAARTARVAIGAALATVGVLGALAVTDRPGADRTPASTEALELHGDVAEDLGRDSRGLDGSGPGGGPDIGAPVPVTGPDPGESDGALPGGIALVPATGPTRTAPPPENGAGDPDRGGSPDAPSGPARTPEPTPGPTRPPPFYLPGAQDAPVTGPVADHDHDHDDDDVDLDVDPSPPDPSTPDPEPHEPEAPEPDEEGCPNLDLYPIGGFASGAPDAFAALSPRFRDLAPAEWANPTLVCGYPLESWRDLVVQRLVTGGEPDGALITAADGSSIVLRVDEIEWATYRFRYGGGPDGPNLVGHPVGRLQWGTVEVIRTTNGGLVFAHPGSMGVPVLGGAWDRWMADGGVDGPMGLPLGRPESATGPIGADVWVDGLPATGARQDFTHGWLFLPGVMTDVEAAAQPADRYQWHDLSELGPFPEEPVDYRGQIMQISGISFYVDATGVRHWIATTSDWSCARWDLGATEYRVRSFELAAYPLGDVFVCDDHKGDD